MGTERGLCGLGFADETGDDCGDGRSARPLAQRRLRRGARAHRALGRRPPSASRGEARLYLIGAPFQIKVWEALLAVPSGQVTTYSEIARFIGHPKAVRAVGTAVGRNPVSPG